MIININPLEIQMVKPEDFHLEWEKAVRALPMEKRLERVKLGFADPDIKRNSND